MERTPRRSSGLFCRRQALLLACALAWMLVHATVGVMAAPAAPSAKAGVVTDVLSNGLQVAIVRDPLAPVVTVVMNYKAGSDDEGITGTAHALEHMMFRGSRSLDAGGFGLVAALLGGRFNAETRDVVTRYHFTVPAAQLDAALRLEASRAQGLLVDATAWSQEKRAMIQEADEDRSEAENRLHVKILHHVMAGTPHANEGMGTRRTLGSEIQPAHLLQFYRTWYRPNNAVLVICGDVEPVRALDRVRALFGGVPAAAVPRRRPAPPAAPRPAVFRERSDSPQLTCMVAYRFPGRGDPDFPASQVLADVLNSPRGVLAGLVSSGQVYDTDFTTHAFAGAGMAVAVVTAPSTLSPPKAVKLLQDALEQYRINGVPPALVEVARRREAAAWQARRTSIEGLAMAWSDALAVEGWDGPDRVLQALERVTPQDVDRVLRRYLVRATATVGISLPSTGSGVSGPVSSGRRGASREAARLAPVKGAVLPPWARGIVAHLALPRQTLHPVSFRLGNGLRVVVQHDPLVPTVTLRGEVRSEATLQEPRGLEGVAEVAEELLAYGPAPWSRVEWERRLDGCCAEIGLGRSFSMRVPSAGFDDGLGLLARGLLEPAFRAGDFAVLKRQEHQATLESLHSPERLAAVALNHALFPPGDAIHRVPVPASIARLRLSDVRAWHGRVFRPDMTTIVVVGDATPQRVREAMNRCFRAWAARGPRPCVDLPAVPDHRPASISVPDPGRVQARVTLAQTLRMGRGHPDLAPLAVADSLLSGGFYASMLYHDLRETRGYVYSVDTTLSVGRLRSTFEVEYASSPRDVGRAEAVVVQDLERLQRTRVDAGRLRRAKALLLASLSVQARSHGGVASLLLDLASHGLPLHQDRVDMSRQLAVTPEQLRRAACRWLRPRGMVRLVQGPALR